MRRLVTRAEAPARPELTEREQEVLALLVAGYPRSDIARELAISRKTAAKHIEHILHKLDVHSEAQAVALVARERVV